MKKRRLYLLVILLPLIGLCQVKAQEFLWPIEGQPAGTGVLYTPQSNIGDEFNFGDLFITAPEGATVVAPFDGTIERISYGYKTGLYYANSWAHGELTDFEEIADMIMEKSKGAVPRKNIFKYLTISSGNLRLHISGLRGNETFKTGERITRGTPIGTVGYSYKGIEEPSILLALTRGWKGSDPMTPFGLRTTYIPWTEAEPVTSLTKAQAREDFLFYTGVLKEVFVGLNNVITDDELENYITEKLAVIDRYPDELPIKFFRNIMHETVAKVHDSHIYLYPDGDLEYMPAIWIGAFGEGPLRCTNAITGYEHLVGREILSVNGVPADSVRQVILSDVTHYDAGVESVKEYELATRGFMGFFRRPHGDPDFNMTVEFAGGEVFDIEGIKPDEAKMIYSLDNYHKWNRHGRNKFRPRRISESTAYLGISEFKLNEVELAEIGDFIKSVGDRKNLIIDVRNCPGGDADAIMRIFSYIAGETMILDGYSKVNERDGYDAFRKSTNYPPNADPFAAYEPREGMPGFYSEPATGNTVEPHPEINYKGRIYVLTNEFSASAAALFPALVVLNDRGVVVGRETRTAFHFMNAEKYLEMSLPNSRIRLKVPLVETHVATTVTERMPYGRGVLPDYPVELTWEELTAERDPVLDYTLWLIDEGLYDPRDNSRRSFPYILCIVAVGVLVAAAVVFVARRKQKARPV